MTIILPRWTRNYMTIQGDDINIKIPSLGDDPDFFRKKKKALQKFSMSNTDWSDKSSSDMKSFIQDYILCNVVLGFTDKTKASNANRKAVKKSANEGNGRQHWIPESYMNRFAEKNHVRKVPKIIFSKVSGKDTIQPELKPISGEEFRETKRTKGKLYDPHYELFLSKIENDYSLLNDQFYKQPSLWDFIVSASFLLILDSRTTHTQKQNNAKWNMKVGMLIDVLPELVSEMEILHYCPEDFIASDLVESGIKLPFTQHPILSFHEGPDSLWVSFWAIYSPECLLFFRNKNSGLKNTRKEVAKAFQALINADKDNLYFRPSDPIWDCKLPR